MRWPALLLLLVVTGCGSSRPADEDGWLSATHAQVAIVLRADAAAVAACSTGVPSCQPSLNVAEVQGRALQEQTQRAPACLAGYAARVRAAAADGWHAATSGTRLSELDASAARLRAIPPPRLAPAALRALPGWPCA